MAIVALAVAVATAGTGSGISVAVTGSVTVGAMAGSVFTALVSRANISLINNQSNVKVA